MGFISFFRDVLGYDPKFVRKVDVRQSRASKGHDTYGIDMDGRYFVEGWSGWRSWRSSCNSNRFGPYALKQLQPSEVPEEVREALETDDVKIPCLEDSVITTISYYTPSVHRYEITRSSTLDSLGIEPNIVPIASSLRHLQAGISVRILLDCETVGDLLDYIKSNIDLREYECFPEICLEEIRGDKAIKGMFNKKP